METGREGRGEGGKEREGRVRGGGREGARGREGRREGGREGGREEDREEGAGVVHEQGNRPLVETHIDARETQTQRRTRRRHREDTRTNQHTHTHTSINRQTVNCETDGRGENGPTRTLHTFAHAVLVLTVHHENDGFRAFVVVSPCVANLRQATRAACVQ